LISVYFLDRNVGWVQEDNRISHTRDGGYSWTRLELPTYLGAATILFFDDENGLAFGLRGGPLEGYVSWINHGYTLTDYVSLAEISRTNDGGATWHPIFLPIAGPLLRAAFAGRDHGWAVGEGGTILHTSDGGQTWQRQSCPVRGTVWWVECSDKTSARALVSGVPQPHELIERRAIEIWEERGRRVGYQHEDWIEAESQLGTRDVEILTSDGGATWVEQPSAEARLTPGYPSPWFADELVGARPARYDIERTTDGGRTWQTVPSHWSRANMVIDLCFAEGVGYAVAGNYGGTFTFIRSEDGGVSWKSIYYDGIGRIDDDE